MRAVRLVALVALVAATGSSPAATAVEPSLSSVRQPTFSIGEKAADLLIRQITSGKFMGEMKVVLEGEINIRESTNNLNNYENS